MAERAPSIGIINRDIELINLMSVILGSAGYKSIASMLLCDVREVQEDQKDFDPYAVFVRKNQPSIVILDVPPPYIPNWERALRIMKHEQSANIEFVVTTSHINKVTKLKGQTGLQSGIKLPRVIVEEPFDYTRLVRAVTRCNFIATYRLQQNNLPMTSEPDQPWNRQ